MTRLRYIFLLGVIVACLGLAMPVRSATTALVATKLRLTAAPRAGQSVILATLSNTSNQPIIIYRISSPAAPTAMLHYDANMCHKGSRMNLLPMVVIPSHHSLKLSIRGIGAMLSPLRHTLHTGHVESVTIRWRIGSQSQVTRFQASIVKPPKGLQTKRVRSRQVG
jgi:copper(I)-binding protein